MAFRRDPISQNLIFESKPAAGSTATLPDHFMTRIVLDSAGKSIMSVGAFRIGLETFTIKCQPSPIFKIKFDKFNLKDYVYGTTLVEYSGGTPQVLSQPGAPELRIKYADVPANLSGYDKIDVEISLKEAAEPGWIEFDIAYTCPPQFLSNPAVEAWSPTLIYPIVRLDHDSSNPSVREHVLLNSQGILGKLTDLAAGDNGCLMTVQFGAIYHSNYSFYGEHFANGLAISADDEAGNYKELHYSNDLPSKTTLVSTLLKQPIHLKNKQYVFSYHSAHGSPNYRLSYKGADGFGGAGMRYRLRAFHLEKPVNGGPVDWHDVAELYRTLAKKRSFYSKYNYQQRKGGHIDSMNPHTIVCNYGLDGPINPDEDLTVRNALELHPMVAKPATDMPGNENEALPDLLKRLRDRFTLRDSFKLEAQIWGFEMGGFYRFIGGYPPITNVLAQNNNKFRQALGGLVAAGILPCVTTDPLATNFVRKRFRGHLKHEGTTWKPFITQPFPTRMTQFAPGALKTCATTTDASSNRLFHVDGCPEATTLRNNWKVLPYLNPLPYRLITFDPNKGPFATLTRFYAIQTNAICPTKEVEDLYINGWLIKHLFSEPSSTNGVKLLEFMKHHPAGFYCFDRDHEHINPRPSADKPYDNAIGFGAWYINRVKRIFQRIHDEGLARCGKDFALTTEFVPPEVLAPFVDDYYEYDSSTYQVYHGDTRSAQNLPYLKPYVVRKAPLFQYVYNPFVGQKMNLADSDWTIHAGYKEKRNSKALVLRTLGADKDTALLPNPDDQNARMASFAAWQNESIKDFELCYTVEHPGLSPQNYPTTTGTYSYRRGIQDIFNLRSRIFRFGAAAVRGERILLPAAWIERPTLPPLPPSQLYEYNEEAIKMAVRAAQLQNVFKQFFRGEMLGQTDIDPSASVWAWRVRVGDFGDFLELVKEVGFTDQEIYSNPPPDPPVSLSVRDFISRRHDVYETAPVAAVFSKADLMDATGFLLTLRNGQDPVTLYLRTGFSPALQELIRVYNGSPPSDMLQTSLVAGLNAVLDDVLLFTVQRFAQITLRPLTRFLTQKPPGQKLPSLNRLLIEDAYPQVARRDLTTSNTIITDKIQHMIWRAPDLKVLYAFANVGNSPQQIKFNYTRGVEGPGPWVSVRRAFVGDPDDNRGGIVGNPEPIKFGQYVTVTIPERAIFAYEISKQ
jgi:hypothetical protein